MGKNDDNLGSSKGKVLISQSQTKKDTKMKNLSRIEKYKLAKTSLLHQTKEFFNQSTLHGIRYIAEDERPFVERGLWLICTSIGATVTMIIIVSLWEKFQTNPTITGLDTDFHDWDVPFPGVSLCQNDPVDPKRVDNLIESEYKDVQPREELRKYLHFLGQIKPTRIPEFSAFTKYNNFPQDNLMDLAKQVINRCEDIMSPTCTWKDDQVPCCKYFLPILTENGFCFSFNVLPSQGVFLFNSTEPPKVNVEYIYETDPKWAIEVNVIDAHINNVDIYLHSANEQPGIDLRSDHLWNKRIFKMSFSAKTTYTTDDALQLSIKQRRCVFPNEIKLLTDDTYSYGACMRECRMKAMLEKCNCIPFYYEKVDKYPHCTLEGLACLGQNMDVVLSTELCECELCCDNTVYEVEKLAEWEGHKDANIQPNESYIDIAFVSWPMIRYKREVLFGWVDLLVSFGGIAGLFLGFSLLSGVEIIYYFTMRACCMAARDREMLQKFAKEYELKNSNSLDLSLTPYFMQKENRTETTDLNIRHVQPYRAHMY